MEKWFSIFQKLNSIQKTDLEIRNFKVKNKDFKNNQNLNLKTEKSDKKQIVKKIYLFDKKNLKKNGK
jgi:hypothetical protein